MSEDAKTPPPPDGPPPPVRDPFGADGRGDAAGPEPPPSPPPPPPPPDETDGEDKEAPAKNGGEDLPPPPGAGGEGNGGEGGVARPGAARNGMAGALVSTLLLCALVASFWIRGGGEKPAVLAYEPDFTELLANGFVRKVEIVHDGAQTFARGTLDAPESAPPGRAAELAAAYPPRTPFRVNLGEETDGVERALRAAGAGWEHVYQDHRFMMVLLNVLPLVLFGGLFYYIFVKQMRAGDRALGFGRSRARRLEQDGGAKVRFKDVAGCAEAKEEMQEIVAYLKDPKKFARLGAKMPHGILLEGPPGTGKTLLAKAIAGEAGVPFFSISGSDFVEMFVGVGASRVRDMFAQAKKSKPCLLFIDEIDAVGRSRFTGIGGGHDEREQTLNALLVEMDGFESNDGVVVIAATNRPDVLDPALLRPGRFDREVVVGLPTMEDRLAILQVHAAKVKLAPGTDLSRVARGTPGCSGADLANIVNEAAILASKAEKPGVDIDDFEEARDRILFGRENSARNKSMDEKEKRLTAYHESGHAVLTVLAGEDADPVHKVTIIPRGMAMGATMFLPKKDRNSLSRRHLLADLVISMGGRVAEEMFLDDVTTGARQDLKQATGLARAMVCDWGLSETLGPRTFGVNQELMFLGREVNRTQDYSDETARRIDAEVTRLLREAHDKARAQLEAHRAAVELMAATLLEKETIDGAVAEAIVRTGRLPEPEPPPAPPPPVPAPPAPTPAA